MAIDAGDVTACLVTRGDVPMDAIVDSLAFERVIIWDNSREPYNLSVYGRYAAIDRIDTPYVFCQDDDVLLAPATFDALLAAHEPGHVTCNMPQRFRDTGSYEDSALVGFGAIFDRMLPVVACARLIDHARKTPTEYARAITDADGWHTWFNRECDTVFTMLTPRILVDLPYEDLPWASDPNRLWKQPEHVGERERMRQLVRQVRDA